MSNQPFVQNFGYGTLASGITNVSTSMTMNSGHNFNIDTSESFVLIIWDSVTYPNPADDPNLEIVEATYSGTLNIYNITRAHENTTAVAHAAGSGCAMTITAGIDTAHGFAIFSTAGSFSWTAPEYVTEVLITGCGAGGPGGNSSSRAAGGGASAQEVKNYPYTVVPKTTYSITIPGQSSPGSDGGNAVFDLLTLLGGLRGVNGGGTGTAAGGVGYSPTGASSTNGGAGGQIPSNSGGSGQSGGASIVGGGGAASSFGNGGNGGPVAIDGSNGSGFGAGGGGAGTGANNGGKGSPGFIVIIW